jgi:hypothetical protein
MRGSNSQSRPGTAHNESERRESGFADEIGRVLTWPAEEYQICEAMKLVPDELVQLITASGIPDECRAKVQEYIEAAARSRSG